MFFLIAKRPLEAVLQSIEIVRILKIYRGLPVVPFPVLPDVFPDVWLVEPLPDPGLPVPVLPDPVPVPVPRLFIVSYEPVPELYCEPDVPEVPEALVSSVRLALFMSSVSSFARSQLAAPASKATKAAMVIKCLRFILMRCFWCLNYWQCAAHRTTIEARHRAAPRGF
jgi:hypothetical protein